MRIFKALIIFLTLVFCSCGRVSIAQIWTDRPEFALYGEFFNTVQSQYKVSVKYVEFPAQEITRHNRPDLIVASWLKNSATNTTFKSIDNLFGANRLTRNIFYSRLLAVGRIDRNQYLIPVSFNIPALIFSGNRVNDLSSQFTINFDEIKNRSRPFNAMSRGLYTRMGFSPHWDDNFLLTAAVLSGASFREESPLTWDSAALEQSMSSINNWTIEINGGHQAEEDFTFKYFFEPPDRLVQSGRILFSYMESDELFLLSEDRKTNLDFRWIMEQNMLPVTDKTVYMGIPKRAKSRSAARAFIQWFFTVETQRTLLEFSRANRINENVFGICGGFSALSSVTEQVYPLFYPELLGRMPPSENFTLPNVLPANWVVLRERVILPYLGERSRSDGRDIYPLDKRIGDWIRLTR